MQAMLFKIVFLYRCPGTVAREAGQTVATFFLQWGCDTPAREFNYQFPTNPFELSTPSCLRQKVTSTFGWIVTGGL